METVERRMESLIPRRLPRIDLPPAESGYLFHFLRLWLPKFITYVTFLYKYTTMAIIQRGPDRVELSLRPFA